MKKTIVQTDSRNQKTTHKTNKQNKTKKMISRHQQQDKNLADQSAQYCPFLLTFFSSFD